MVRRGQHKVIGADGKAYWQRQDGSRYLVGSTVARKPDPNEPGPAPLPAEPFVHPGGIEGPGLVNGVWTEAVEIPPGTHMFQERDPEAVRSSLARIEDARPPVAFTERDPLVQMSPPARIEAAKNRAAVRGSLGGRKIQPPPQTQRTAHPSVSSVPSLRDRLRDGAEGRARAATIKEAMRARDAYLDMMYAAFVAVSGGMDPYNCVLREEPTEDGGTLYYFERTDARAKSDTAAR